MMCPDMASISVSKRGHDGVVYLLITKIEPQDDIPTQCCYQYGYCWKQRVMMRQRKRMYLLRTTKTTSELISGQH
jgi:hypothetical protein